MRGRERVIMIAVRTQTSGPKRVTHPSHRARGDHLATPCQGPLPAEVRGRHGDDCGVVPHDVPRAEREDDRVVALLPEYERLAVAIEKRLALKLGDVSRLLRRRHDRVRSRARAVRLPLNAALVVVSVPASGTAEVLDATSLVLLSGPLLSEVDGHFLDVNGSAEPSVGVAAP
jgi:hypothetical protein